MALQSDQLAKVVIGLGVLAVLLLLYGIFILRAPLQWFGIVIPFIFLYLVWRFVRAHERIADAVEESVGRESSIVGSEE